MTIEEEMRHEVARLQRDLESIDVDLEKLHSRIVQLMDVRKKKEYDLRILRSSVDEEYVRRREEESLERIMRDMRKIKA